MRTVLIHIAGTAPYSASRIHETPKLDKEGHDAYDLRTWREKANTDAAGMVVIPAMAFKQALSTAARKLGLQIPGRGKSTYTKYFEADVICTADAALNVHKDALQPVSIWANADGIRGSGKRVKRTFPVIPGWAAQVPFLIMDDTITPQVFEQVARAAGTGVGVGRFRPENGGVNGRFDCRQFVWDAAI